MYPLDHLKVLPAGNIAALVRRSERTPSVDSVVNLKSVQHSYMLANYRCHNIRENLTADEMLS